MATHGTEAKGSSPDDLSLADFARCDSARAVAREIVLTLIVCFAVATLILVAAPFWRTVDQHIDSRIGTLHSEITSDRAHLAGAHALACNLSPKAVRAVGGESAMTRYENSAETEVDHGQVNSRHSCDWNVSTIAARRFVATARRAVFSFAAIDREHGAGTFTDGGTNTPRRHAMLAVERRSVANGDRHTSVASSNRRYSAYQDQLVRAACTWSDLRAGGSWKFTNTFSLKGIPL